MSKTVLITGASQGIGAATARVFAAAGYDVAINYFRSQDKAETLAEECRKVGVQVVVVQADCSQETELKRLAEEVHQKFGLIDVLVNNFGLSDEPEFENASQQDMLNALNISLVSTMLAVRIFVPKLMKPQASVLNVASMYGLNQSAGLKHPIYSAGKAGLINFTQGMAKKHAPHIRFNVVAPGFTKTPHWDTADPERAKACIDSTLQKEWVQPEDIAKTLLFLAESPHITAETIVVDAGWSKR